MENGNDIINAQHNFLNIMRTFFSLSFFPLVIKKKINLWDAVITAIPFSLDKKKPKERIFICLPKENQNDIFHIFRCLHTHAIEWKLPGHLLHTVLFFSVPFRCSSFSFEGICSHMQGKKTQLNHNSNNKNTHKNVYTLYSPMAHRLFTPTAHPIYVCIFMVPAVVCGIRCLHEIYLYTRGPITPGIKTNNKPFNLNNNDNNTCEFL